MTGHSEPVARGPMWLRLALFFLSLGFALLLSLVVAGYIIDDAYISFRYADNLVREGSLYYNKGEQGPFGYTNPLYVFLLAALRLASRGTLSFEAISRGMGALSLATILFVLLSAITQGSEGSGRLERGSRLAMGSLALLLFLGFPYLLPNFYSGLETGLFTLCLFVMLVSLDAGRPRTEACFLAALAAALGLRIDGFLIVLPLLAAYSLNALRHSEAARILRLGYAFLAAGLVYALQFALAGFWVPLSFYQKSSPFSPRTVWSYATFFLLVLAPLAAIVHRRTRRRLTALAIFYSLFASLFYGFFMNWMFKRYVFPVAFALFAVLLLALLELDLARHRRETILLALCALFTFPAHAFEGYSWISGHRVAMLNARRIAEALAAADLPSGHRIFAAEDAGYFAYRSDWRLLDLLGLTTPEILTEGAAGAVGRLGPTVLILNAPNGHRPEALRLRSGAGRPEAPIPAGYQFVKHLPFTNRYWWPERDYGYFIFVNRNASPKLIEALQKVTVDVEREMGWQTFGFRLLRRLTWMGF